MPLEEYKLLFEEYLNEKVSKKSEYGLKFRFHKLWKILQISMFVFPQLLAARNVTAAMLVVKNKIISLLWELNSIFKYILREKNYSLLTLNMAALSRGCKPKVARPLATSRRGSFWPLNSS